MLKKAFRIALIALCALAVLALAAAGLCRLVWGRSVQASIYEVMLRRRFASARTAEEEVARLEAKREAGEPAYAIPKGVELHVSLRRNEGEGMGWFALNEGAGDLTVFYLHGGAYINNINAYQWRFMDRLARTAGCEVIAPNYHLAPFGDCARAYADIPALYRAYAAAHPNRRIALMGDSAGGGLALGIAEALVKQGDPLPERLILFSPWVDVSMDNPDIRDYIPVEPILHYDLVKVHGEYWAGNAGTHNWMASPLFGDMAGLPPVTIYVGTRELLYPDIRILQQRLEEAGVASDLHVGRGLNHDYPLMPLPEARAVLREVTGLLKQ